MIREFTHNRIANITEMAARCTEMLEILELLDEGSIGDGKAYSSEDLEFYVRSLVTGQRESIGKTIPGSWSVAPNDDDMDSDARVDFIFVPTYIAIATLSRVVCEFVSVRQTPS